MERQKQQTLDKKADEFDGVVPKGRMLREQLERAAWTVTRIRPSPGRRSWFMYLQPSLKLRRRFDLAPEVLAVIAPFEQAQAGDLDAAAHALRETQRLDRGLILFFTNDSHAEQELASISPPERATIFLSIDEFLTTPDPETTVRKRLAEYLASSRPFAPGSPVSDWQFFGRQTELLTLERRLLETAQPVGLFGLRKMGKTSLIHRLRHKWRQDRNADGPRAILIYCDLQSIPFNRRTRGGLMRMLLEEFRASVADFALEGLFHGRPWRTSDLRALDEQDLTRLATDALDDILDWTARSPVAKVVLAIDEYERLLNEAIFPRDVGLDFLDLVRGLTQQHPNSFSFLVIGLHREWVLRARYDRRQNPLYGVLFQMPLAGLSRPDLGTLVRKLGRRAGLDFNLEATERIYQESGGHPYITRLLTDLIDERSPRARLDPIPVSGKSVSDILPSLDREAVTTMIELADSAEDLARSIDKSSLAAVTSWLRRIDAPAPSEIRDDLARYGFVDSATTLVKIEAFSRWTRQNYQQLGDAVHG